MEETAVAWQWLAFCAVYIPMGTFYLVFGVSSRRKLLKLILKCIPILLLFFYVLSFLVFSAYQAESQVDEGARDKRQIEISRIHTFLWGLAFSCIGDACLVIPRLRPFGVLSFAVSICIYIGLFSFNLDTVLSLGLNGLLLSLPVFLVLVFLLTVLLKRDVRAQVKPILLVLVCGYFTLISLMLWSSLLRLEKQRDLASVYGAIGALLFYVSDISIAASAIWGANLILFQGRVLIMTTYYGAQLFLALSV